MVFESPVLSYADPFAYITLKGAPGVQCIDMSDDSLSGPVIQTPAGNGPVGIAVDPVRHRAYVANDDIPGTITVINTSTNSVVGTPISVGAAPLGVVVNPAGTFVYVANSATNTVSIINTQTSGVQTITVGNNPYGIAINPAGTRVF